MRAGSTPSGTPAPSAMRSSRCSNHPTGGRGAAPGGDPSRAPSTTTVGSGNSVTRHAVPRSSTKRRAAASRASTARPSATSTPVSRPPICSSASAPVSRTPISVPRALMSPRPSSSPNQNRPGNPASSGSARSRVSRSMTMARTSPHPPTRPDSGEATMLRTRSWLGVGSSPAPTTASATASASDGPSMPRICTLPRPVNSRVPAPWSRAVTARVCNCAAVRRPPGSRMRASAPSAASCRLSAPGQASSGRVRTTRPRYRRPCGTNGG